MKGNEGCNKGNSPETGGKKTARIARKMSEPHMLYDCIGFPASKAVVEHAREIVSSNLWIENHKEKSKSRAVNQ